MEKTSMNVGKGVYASIRNGYKSMKKSSLVILSMITFLVLFFGSKVMAQDGYKGIIPMLSTCHDVKDILIDAECGNNEQFFKLPDETLQIVYTTKECHKFYGKKWNVPVGTVVSVTRRLRKSQTWEDLGITIDESEYNLSYTDVIGQVIYERKKGGLTIVATGKYISDIDYTPTVEDYSKTCGKSPENSNTEFSYDDSFDSYGVIPWAEEKRHLDNFAAYLKRHSEMKGYLVYQPGKNENMGKLRERAERARKYLVRHREIGEERIVVEFAAGRETLKIALHQIPKMPQL
jgi:hypothetical protein